MYCLRFISIGLVTLALSACATGSSKFACPRPQGVTCMSATDVYRATNNADEVVGVDASEAAKLATQGKSAGKVASPGPAPVVADVTPAASVALPASAPAQLHLDGSTLALSPPGSRVVTDPSQYNSASAVGTRQAATRQRGVPALGADSSPDAFRQPAKIMRIYVRPWEDDAGDLHMSGFIFTEIEPRKWSVAQKASDDDGLFRLLEAPGKDAAQEAPAGVGKATPTAPRTGNGGGANP